MTDNPRADQPAAPQFMSRRERREYERRLAQADGAPDSPVEETPPTDTAVDEVSHSLAQDEASHATPQPLAADGPGGLQQQPRRPEDSAADQQRFYTSEINLDHGGLQPLPNDQRDYPQLTQTSEAPHDETADPSGDNALGYMLVANGNSTTAQPDEHEMKTRKARKRKRTLVMLSSFVVFLGLLAVVGLGVSQLIGWTNNDYPGPGGAEVVFEVRPGEGPIVIGNRLVEADIVASTGAFRDAVEAVKTTSSIQPGEYTLRYQMPAHDAAKIFLRVGIPGMNYVHINSGHRIDEVFKNLADRTDYTVEEFEAAADPTNFELPAEATSLEGYMAVGEYHFPLDATPEEILEILIQPTMDEFERLGVSEPAEQHRLVTIASIVEAEARPEDYATVAGIIENRLKPSNPETAGLLQIDATVIYGMGVRQLQFSAADREDASNAYNTYVHRGLPPGPIGAPSIAALDAAFAPESSEYYYWITTNIETGETKFSRTYDQHRAYQQEYREYCDDHPEICGRG